MNANLISESDLYAAYNANLLPQFMMFNEPFTWNVVSGSGGGSNQQLNAYEGWGSLRFRAAGTDGVIINTSGNETQLTIAKSGKHILSFSALEAGGGANTESIEVSVRLFINGSPTDITFQSAADAEEKDVPNLYFAVLNFLESDVVQFGFGAASSGAGNTYYFFFDRFKLEYDRFNIGYPTTFSLPEIKGVSGTFTSADTPAKTVTVVNGIITAIIEEA